MPKIIVLEAFKFAHFGYEVETFEPHPDREPRETTQEVVDVLKDEGLFEVVPDDGWQLEDSKAPAKKTAKAKA